MFLGVVLYVQLYKNIRVNHQQEIINYELDEINSDVILDVKIRVYNNLHKSM